MKTYLEAGTMEWMMTMVDKIEDCLKKMMILLLLINNVVLILL